MCFTETLVGISICTAVFGAYCATKRVSFSNSVRVWNRGSSESPRLHFVTRRDFASLAKSTHDQVVFHLQSSQSIRDHANSSHLGLGITFEELEKCIVWIPYDSSIFVSSADGFSLSLLRKLKKLRTKREIFLIRELADNSCFTGTTEARVL
jgi:hypothetical protein